MKQSSSLSISFSTTCSIFLALNLFASFINHIDDTDEVYGYWEPLHYLLYGNGLQTWEYAPEYAIRTYAFIAPIYSCIYALKLYAVPKEIMFPFVRIILGAITAYCETRFVSSILYYFGENEFIMTLCLMLSSPGIFFSSTSYLPSAVTMNFVMLASSNWLDGHFVSTIAYGSVAVLWSGWPFVGLLFLPLGISMIISIFCHSDSNTAISGFKGGAGGCIHFALSGLLVVAITAIPAAVLDFQMYGKRTSPTINILLYNAIGGSGDELYGIEPVSYYVRNLFLNMGLSWVMVIASPILWLLQYASLVVSANNSGNRSDSKVWAKVVLFIPALLWLLVLFSRPHKEERFMYPIYPLLAFIAACGSQSVLQIACNAFNFLTVTNANTANKASSESSQQDRKEGEQWPRIAVFGMIITASALLFASRIASNYRNYNGYMMLWSDARELIQLESIEAPGGKSVRVCTGNEWYLFPSHFFLPEGAELAFLEDGFHGILPQPFAAQHGTLAVPSQPFNDQNREEFSRYTRLQNCDYVAVIVDRNDPAASSMIGAEYQSRRHQLLQSLPATLQNLSADQPSSTCETGQDINQCINKTPSTALSSDLKGQKVTIASIPFSIAAHRQVLSQAFSRSAVLRAYFIPVLSTRSNKWKDYLLLKNERITPP